MPKWADYAITKVQYNASGTHITRVQVRPDRGDTLGPAQGASRAWVVSEIERQVTFVTAPPSPSDGVPTRGAAVGIVHINGIKYIRSDADRTARDNLANLPRLH